MHSSLSYPIKKTAGSHLPAVLRGVSVSDQYAAQDKVDYNGHNGRKGDRNEPGVNDVDDYLAVDAVNALRQANARFSARYMRMEALAAEAGEVFADLPLPEKEAFWQQAKKLVG